MNKTIIINMNGAIFHIEEDAYEILKAYMTDVKRHFYNSADSLEITTDIENRIAEMFTELLTTASKQVIAEQDVQYVIAQMGSVKDFDPETEETTGGTATAGSTIPPYTGAGRKLYRDADDHILGGVCAGLGNYFDIETVWVRLAFAIAFIFAGTGLLIYVILWIIVPKAITRADRMSMRGERLDLQGFKRNFEEEMSGVKSHLATLHEEARPLIHKTRAFAGSAAHHTGEVLGDAGRAIAKLLAIVISIFCCLSIVSILVGIIGFVGYGVTSFGPGGFENIFPMNVIDYQHNVLFFAAAFLVISIPLLTIMLLVLSAAFNRARFAKTTGFTMLALWLVSVCVVIYFSARIASEFKESASFTQTVNLQPDSTNTYYLKLNAIKYLSPEDSARLDIKNRFNGRVVINDDGDELRSPGHNISIYIEKSDVSQPVLEETYSARGNTYANALMNARNTTYLFSQKGSTLTFGNRLQIASDHLWRNQELTLTLKLPLNSKVVIDEALNAYVRADIYECRDNNKHEHDATTAFTITDNGPQCIIDTLKTPVKPDEE